MKSTSAGSWSEAIRKGGKEKIGEGAVIRSGKTLTFDSGLLQSSGANFEGGSSASTLMCQMRSVPTKYTSWDCTCASTSTGTTIGISMLPCYR